MDLRSNGSAWLAVFFHTAGNYFVFLSLTLFPGLRGVDSVRAWHTAAISLFALLAAINMSRRADRGVDEGAAAESSRVVEQTRSIPFDQR